MTSLAEIAVQRLIAQGMQKAEDRARWFDSIMAKPNELEPFDVVPPYIVVQLRKKRKHEPVREALGIAKRLIDDGRIKYAQGNVYWLAQGCGLTMIISDDQMLQLLASVELNQEISEKVAGLVLRACRAGAHNDETTKAKERRDAAQP